MKYKIYRNKKRINAVVTYSKRKPYVFNPAYRKNDKIIDINRFVLYDSWMIDNVLEKKYIRRYKNLLKMVYLYFNDVLPDDAGASAVLGESSKLRAILLDKYHKYLSLSKEKKFLKELDYIDSEIKMSYIERRIYESQVMEFNGFNR